MQQAMFVPFLLLSLLLICSDKVSARSQLYTQMEKQTFSNRSSFLGTAGTANEVQHYAVYMTTSSSVLTGGMATFDVYGLKQLKNQEITSSAVIWVVNQQGDDYDNGNAISAGWTVQPSFYHDTKTHFFIEWTADGYRKTGCYNLECDGFVNVNYAPITRGDVIEPSDGQVKVTIKIFKKKDDGDWWLYFGHANQNLTAVGYWPQSIFNNLADHASHVMFGGFTQSVVGNASPTMGNGQWPGGKSASVRDVKYVDTSGRGYEPTPSGLIGFMSHSDCYKVTPFANDMFYYGGPGGCTK